MLQRRKMSIIHGRRANTGVTTQWNVKVTRLKPHDVIVATNIAGRRMSLKTTTELESRGGLHVVSAYVPYNIRVEMQAWRKTARKSKNGSEKFIVYDPRVSTSQEDINIDYSFKARDESRMSILKYNLVKNAAQKIIDANINFAGFGYYYHSLALFGDGTSDTQIYQQAMDELEKAILLLKKKADMLKTQGQLVKSANSIQRQ